MKGLKNCLYGCLKDCEKKLLFCAAFFLCAGGVLCAQNEIPADGAGAAAIQETVKESEGGKKTEDSKKDKPSKKDEKSKKSDSSKKTENASGAAKKTETTKIDAYLGDVYIPVKEYSLRQENYSVECEAEHGTFNVFYSNGRTGKKTALLSELENSSSTSFYLKVGKTVYCLNKNSIVEKELWKTASGVRLVYTIKNKARVAVNFSFVPLEEIEKVFKTPEVSESGEKEETVLQVYDESEEVLEPEEVLPAVIKVEVFVTNLSGKKGDFAVKAVFDTALGEGSDIHFITGNSLAFNSEHQFENMLKERSLCVSNSKVSGEFVFEGKNISSPETVSVANISYLNSPRWTFVAENGRSFTSLSAYNNSGIAVIWPQKRLLNEETYTVNFFMGIAGSGRKCETVKYVDFVQEKQAVPAASDVQSESSDVQKSKKNDVDFIVKNVTEKQLDFEYIQNLINRIDALETTGDDIDRNELRQLNAELDAILAALRKRN